VHRHPTHLVRDGIYDDFHARLLEPIAAGQVGDPCDWQTDAGPLVN
jgi:acyl-CoA reductase-like NAD-dependent aldehyde dehydrogenase